eukprot:scaffold9028_cov298-Chaetoceros_neogracile.AAC.1
MYVVAIEGEHEDIARTVNADSSFNCELGESREVFNESMVAEENDFAIASAACSSSRIASEIPTFSIADRLNSTGRNLPQWILSVIRWTKASRTPSPASIPRAAFQY